MLITGKQYRDRLKQKKVFGGGSLWTRVKNFAKKVFGSKKGQEYFKKGVNFLLKKSPELIDKGVSAIDSKLSGTTKKMFGDLAKETAPLLKDLATKGINKGQAYLLDKAKPAAISAATVAEEPNAEGSGVRPSGARKRRTRGLRGQSPSGAGVQTISLSPSAKAALSSWTSKH